jgi:phosphonate transport system substrate-binding protein
MRKHLLKISGLILLLSSSLVYSAARYTFAIVPQLYEEWTPVLQRISHETGIVLELKLVASFSQFDAALMKGTADFAYVNPYHVVMAKPVQGYIPLLRDSKPLIGILLARKDSAFKSVKDLNGQTIAFPAVNAFGASLFMRAQLSGDLGLQFTPRYLGTHPNVFRHLARNEVAAGGSVVSAFNDELAEVREQLHIIYKTPEVASHPLVAHPRVPVKDREAIRQAFLALTKDEAGRALLKEIRFPNPVPARYDKDYLPLEALNLQKYYVVEKD